MKKKEFDLALKKPTGKLASKDEDLFAKIVGSLIESWGIVRPQEVMMVNRMVSTWMKMRKVENMLETYDIVFEERDKGGVLIGLAMNPLPAYLSKLDADFRGYYRALQGKIQQKEESKDLIDVMNAVEVKVKKK